MDNSKKNERNFNNFYSPYINLLYNYSCMTLLYTFLLISSMLNIVIDLHNNTLDINLLYNRLASYNDFCSAC